MEVVSSPAVNGAKQWLSELGLEEPSLVRHLDSLLLPSPNQFHSARGYNNHHSLDLSGPLMNVKQRDTSLSMNYNNLISGYSSWEALLNPERPTKIPKSNSWDDSFSSQMQNATTHQGILPLMYNHKNHQQTQNQHVHQQMEQFLPPQQQIACQNLEGFVASLPKLSEDLHESVAPRTPTMDIGGCQVLGGSQDCCSSEFNAVEALSSNGSREHSLSPADSFRGKRKPEFYPPPNDMRLQRPPPVTPAPTSNRTASPPSKASGHTQDHIMAERKRREKLSQRFIALSAIVPGLKKMDKASVLGDAIKYVKTLQDRIQKLEEQAPKPNVSSKAASKKGKDGKGGGSDDEAENETDDADNGEAPDIEARVVDKNVLIKMHCERRKGVVVKSLAELEKLHLVVMNASILSFTSTSLDLTLSAQVEEGYEVTADEIVGALQSFFKLLK